MTRGNRPLFYDLTPSEATALLARQHVGRLALTFHDRVDVEPISYVFADGWVWGRTSPGNKLTTVLHHPWVAFEVDEVEGRVDWRSVVVHGTLYFLDPAGGDKNREAYEAGVRHLREIDTSALTSGDATPHRTTLFRIFADEITTRAATSAPSPKG